MASSATLLCRHCGNYNTGAIEREGGGQGSVAIETTRCADPGCETEMCGACDRHHCDGCGNQFCEQHGTPYCGGSWCLGCLESLDKQLDCSCKRLDVDLEDARGCEQHDANSEWRCALRRLEREAPIVDNNDPDPPDPFADMDLPMPMPVHVAVIDEAARRRATQGVA